jgi:hypothetical protein
MNRVNSAIALIMSLAFVAAFFLKMISADAFIGVAAACIVYFFKPLPVGISPRK